MKIGIAISTRNRPEVLKEALLNHKKHLPQDAKLVVVDDASETPIPSDYRFPHNTGISAAKNKCIELLKGCDHYFLFDDDVWPIVDDWHLPYVNSKIKHLSFTFDTLKNGKNNGRRLLWSRNGLSNYTKPCGCMLYFTKEVVNTIGGLDPDYIQWGFEHIDFSTRAFNAGLTPHRYLDIQGSGKLFYSMDRECTSKASVPSEIKSACILHNKQRFNSKARSKEKIPYDHPSDGILLAAYFNSVDDPQRNEKWEPTPGAVSALVKSCEKNGVDFRVFHDCLDVDDERFIKVPHRTDQAPNVLRYFVFIDWLRRNPFDNVFLVDSTDVEVLRNPFMSINPNKLYVGDEYAMKVDNPWMRTNQEPHLKSLKDYRAVIAANARAVLPNCGITGGAYEMVMEYLEHRVILHGTHTKGVLKSTDMAIFNYIVHKYFKGRTTSGLKINTRFKRYETNKISLFRHK